MKPLDRESLVDALVAFAKGVTDRDIGNFKNALARDAILGIVADFRRNTVGWTDDMLVGEFFVKAHEIVRQTEAEKAIKN